MPEPSETPTEKTFHLSEPPKVRRRSAPWLAGGLVLLLLFVLIVLQMSGLWEFLTPDSAFDTLLLYALSSLNFAAFIVFSFILIRNLLKLRRERRERQLGSKIKTRLVVYFITVSLLPITAMAVFSYLFLNRSLEKWFGRFPEDVVSEARLARTEDEAQRARSLRETSVVSALTVEQQLGQGLEPDLARLLRQGNFVALSLRGPDGVTRAEVAAPATSAQAEDLKTSFSNAIGERGVRVEGVATVGPFLIATVPLGDGSTLLAARANKDDTRLERIVSGSESFEALRREQRKVRMLGLSTLGLMTLLILFAATWSAIHLARGIGTPIRALAEAADQVARGNLSHRVTAIADDELALLAASFNGMTEQLEENRWRIETNAAELREKNMALAERRDYIETVLQSLSTGVISLDEQDRVTTINPAAVMMLRLNGAPASGTELSAIISSEDHAVLERILKRARRVGRAAWQMELGRGLAHESGGLPVALTATALSSLSADGRGVVLVIEDLSELLAAQRAAAWSEVARRMAHEIKNPLTPIQLSAERIWRNFQRARNGDSGEAQTTNGNGAAQISEHEERVARVVEECTQTITREVAGLKAMVDEFSRFARLPQARLEVGDVNEVVRQSVALYEDRLDGMRLDVLLARTLPSSMLDAEQLRRVFVNLIDNALEAMANAEGERRITIATGHDPARGLLLVEVTDTGHGIARQDFQRLFQPYFSTRGRGTGLGLAIVQRIITDHSGRIRAETNRPHGAKFTVELPVTDESQRVEGRR
ncbi:MAG: ATP-binding protein [Acidobacteriota bacterium]|nr:ATP-binding protein [Acidobacteriota bacterium]